MKYTMLNDCPDCKGEYRCNHGKCDCGYCDTCRGTGKVSAEISAGEIEDISKNLFRKAETTEADKEFKDFCEFRKQKFIPSSVVSDSISEILKKIDDKIKDLIPTEKGFFKTSEDGKINGLQEAKQLILEIVEKKQ